MLAKLPAAAKSPNNKWRPPPGPYRVYMSMPCDDGHKLDFWRSLLDLQAAALRGATPHHFRLKATPGDSLVPRARNNHMWDFYFNTADDWFCSTDSDLDFRAVDWFQMFDAPDAIMAGKYAIKQAEMRWCINTLPGHEMDPRTMKQNVAAAGTGILAVHRHVIGTMIAAAGKWKAWPVRYIADGTEEEQFDLFHNGVVHDPNWFPHSPRYLSEDWGFCYMARKLGFAVVLNHRFIALHEGSAKYPLQARRLSREEEMAGVIQQPDGSVSPIA